MTRKNYPRLDVPFHSRWRHFVVNGRDRAEILPRQLADRYERARAAFDLAIVSVLLDAGAGPQWRYRDAATGDSIGRSEGLALASLDMFAHGVFSCAADNPLRADAAALARVDTATLAKGFQIGPANTLIGLEGRAALSR